jgi:CubicO group peptidase (beta-lactamase class C family)
METWNRGQERRRDNGREGSILRLTIASIAALSVIAGAVSNAHAASNNSRAKAAAVDQIFEHPIMPTSPGCAVAVMQNGHIVYEHGYGMADLDHDVKITPTTVFHVGSVSKQFTAMAILMLAREGKLSLDDSVRAYVPEVPDFGVPITLRQLLHHTSGLRDQWELLRLDGWRVGNDLVTDDDILHLVSRQKELNFPPGSEYMYSNTGFTLLAMVVARVSGESFRDYTTSQIFQPLGMSHTHFRDNHAEVVKNIAYGYEAGGASDYDLSVPNYDTVGATSLLTTVEDLARWDENFYTAQVGGEKVIEEMQEPGRLNDGTPIFYAAGLMMDKYRGQEVIDHAGADAGYLADLIRFPAHHFSVATLCNVTTVDPSTMSREVADIYLDKYLAPKPKPDLETHFHPDLKALAAKAGTYVHPRTDTIVRLSVRNGMLWEDGDGFGGPRHALKPVNENHFNLPQYRVEYEFGSKAGAPLMITRKGSDAFSWKFYRQEAYAPTAGRLREFAGTYRSDELDFPYHVDSRNDSLRLSSFKRNSTILFPVAKDLFACRYMQVRFSRDSKGQVSGMSLSTTRVRRLRFARSKRS